MRHQGLCQAPCTLKGEVDIADVTVLTIYQALLSAISVGLIIVDLKNGMFVYVKLYETL